MTSGVLKRTVPAKSFYNQEEILLEATGLQIEYNRIFQRRLDNFDVLNIINQIRKNLKDKKSR